MSDERCPICSAPVELDYDPTTGKYIKYCIAYDCEFRIEDEPAEGDDQ